MAKAKPKKVGRKKGRTNLGYTYKKGQGWYAWNRDTQKLESLVDEHGQRLREKDAPAEAIKQAYARWTLAREEAKKNAPPPSADAREQTTLLEICCDYVEYMKRNDSPKTLQDRSAILFDFCTGYSAKYQDGCEMARKPMIAAEEKQAKREKIHDGYGGLAIRDLRPHHIDEWLARHPGWKGSTRGKVQAIKRAINVAVGAEKIPSNPIRGYPKGDKVKRERVLADNHRATYIAPEQEEAIYRHCRKPMRTAIRVCIRTGARPGCEFAKLTAAHVTDHGDRMEWTFSKQESKTKRERIIYVTDPEIIEIVRTQMQQHPEGPIFRGDKSEPWHWKRLSNNFFRIKRTLQAKGVKLDQDACMYSCRTMSVASSSAVCWTFLPNSARSKHVCVSGSL